MGWRLQLHTLVRTQSKNPPPRCLLIARTLKITNTDIYLHVFMIIVNAAKPTMVPKHYELLQCGLISYHCAGCPRKSGRLDFFSVLSNLKIINILILCVKYLCVK